MNAGYKGVWVQLTTWYTIRFKILFVIQQIKAYFVSAYDHFTTVLILCLQSLHNAYRPLKYDLNSRRIFSIYSSPSWLACSYENYSSCPCLEDSLKETSALASSSLPKSSFMNWDFVPCVTLSISAALVKDFSASSVHSSNLQQGKTGCNVVM